MSLATLFEKLKEREFELNQLVESKEDERKKKGHDLKARINERTSFDSTWCNYGKKGHIKSNCPLNH